MPGEADQQLRAYVDYFRDLGVHDFYRQGEPLVAEIQAVAESRPLPVEADAVVEELDAVAVPS